MDHSARTRRRMAYPILTLCVAGVIWLVSTGRISVEPQVEPAVYESFVREVVESARRGQGPLADGDDLLARSWRRMAPEALQSPDGGAFQVRSEVESDRAPDLVRDPLAGQPVLVRSADGGGVVVFVRFLDGAARIVGVGVLEENADGSMPSRGDE